MTDAKQRATWLRVDEMRRLDHWCFSLRRTFLGEVPYLVGSALDRPDYRDVDVRIILDPDDYHALTNLIDLKDLNMLVSRWGQEQTGLPIDFQLQDRDRANEEFSGRRHARGLIL